MDVKNLVALAALSMLTACGPILLAGMVAGGGKAQKNTMPRATAKYIGQGVKPEDVKVFDAHSGFTNTKWRADTPLGRYSCTGDADVKDVYCVKEQVAQAK